jgi:glycosyltransferase involved in cell wall biosynthesis
MIATRMSFRTIDSAGRRIVFVVPDFDPAVGGTTRQTRLQAESLARRGFRPLVVTRRLEPDWAPEETVAGLDVVRVGPPGRGRSSEGRALAALARRLIRHRGSADVVQIVMWPDAIVASAAAGLVRRTAVLWAIDGEITAALSPARSARRRLQTAVRRRLLSGAQHVTLTSRMASELAAEAPGFANTVIPVPVDRSHFRPPREGEREQARAALGVAPDAFAVLYVGHLQERKAVDRLLDAFAVLLRDAATARLLLVGGGRGAPDDTEEALRRQARDLRLDEAVSFCGIVSDPLRHLWAADVLALSSLREGLPNSLLEALACGVPCVAPAAAGGAEVLDKEVGIVPASNEPAELAAALRRLASDDAARRRMGAAARRHSERYDVDRIAAEYEGLYARMASR